MTDKDRFLIEELERRLCWYRDKATEEEFDAEEVDAICVMLQKLSPIREPHMSREEAYRNIMKRVAEEDGDVGSEREEEAAGRRRDKGRKRKGGFLHERSGYRAAVLFVTVFGAAVLSLNMVTYAREDKSLFTMILERVGLVEIVKEEAGEGISANKNSEIRTFYNSWGELDSEVKRKLMVPKYIPNGYELYGIDYYDLDNRKKIKADYYDKGNRHLVVTITLWENSEKPYKEMTMDEESCVLLSEYSDEGALYYQYEDEYVCMIFMENSFYRISGNIVLDEMIKIREGINNTK